MEIGLYTLSDLIADPKTGIQMNAHDRIDETIKAATLADQVGLDVFGVGEHYRLDFGVSAHECDEHESRRSRLSESDPHSLQRLTLKRRGEAIGRKYRSILSSRPIPSSN